MIALEAHGIVVEKQGRRLLDDVSVRAGAGEFVGIIGPNGSGKTTLLRVLANLLRPTAGHVTIDGERVDGMRAVTRAQRIGYHPQNPELHWPLEVRNIVALGRLPYARGLGALSAEDNATLDAVFEATSLHALLDRRGDSLSGGELARVHVARLLAGQHEVLLADEPIANLDPRFQIEILTVLRGHVNAERTAIAVLHDLNVAARYCDRLLLLADGRMSAAGRPWEVLRPDVVSSVFGVSPDFYRDAGIEHALAAAAASGAA